MTILAATRLYAVSDVGTIIYEIRGGQWCPLKEWSGQRYPRHATKCDAIASLMKRTR